MSHDTDHLVGYVCTGSVRPYRLAMTGHQRAGRRRVPLMGPWEIQQLLGITRSTFRDTVRHPEFPEPLDASLKRGAVWYEAEIMEWARKHRPAKEPLAEEPEGH